MEASDVSTAPTASTTPTASKKRFMLLHVPCNLYLKMIKNTDLRRNITLMFIRKIMNIAHVIIVIVPELSLQSAHACNVRFMCPLKISVIYQNYRYCVVHEGKIYCVSEYKLINDSIVRLHTRCQKQHPTRMNYDTACLRSLGGNDVPTHVYHMGNVRDHLSNVKSGAIKLPDFKYKD